MDSKQLNALKSSSEKSIVVFSASWCGPCKILSQNIDQVKAKLPNAKIYKIDVDENNDLALDENIQSVPTVLYLGNKEPITKKGVQTVGELLSHLNG
jgi:thiol-disulfide isomerase/thioredoxin